MGYSHVKVLPRNTPLDSIDLEIYLSKLNEENLDGEKWLPVDEFLGSYEVSNQGRVRSLPRAKIDSLGRICLSTGCVLKLLDGGHKTQGKQYYQVILRREGKPYVRQVHRLVALAFVPNPDNKPVVNHIDGDPSNNCVQNLEWTTVKENTQHAIRTGLFRPRRYPGMSGYMEGESYHYKASEGRWMLDGQECN